MFFCLLALVNCLRASRGSVCLFTQCVRNKKWMDWRWHLHPKVLVKEKKTLQNLRSWQLFAKMKLFLLWVTWCSWDTEERSNTGEYSPSRRIWASIYPRWLCHQFQNNDVHKHRWHHFSNTTVLHIPYAAVAFFKSPTDSLSQFACFNSCGTKQMPLKFCDFFQCWEKTGSRFQKKKESTLLFLFFSMSIHNKLLVVFSWTLQGLQGKQSSCAFPELVCFVPTAVLNHWILLLSERPVLVDCCESLCSLTKSN